MKQIRDLCATATFLVSFQSAFTTLPTVKGTLYKSTNSINIGRSHTNTKSEKYEYDKKAMFQWHDAG